MIELEKDMPKKLEKDMKEAIKGKGKFVGCAKARPTSNGNSRYIIVMERDGKFYFGQWSKENGYYLETKKGFPTEDSAISNAETRGYFEHRDDGEFPQSTYYSAGEGKSNPQPGNEKMEFKEFQKIYRATHVNR